MACVRAVGFDLDGTLFDHRGASRTGATAFLEDLGVPVTDTVLTAWSAAEDAGFERWRSGAIGFQEQRRERLRSVLPPLGVDLPGDDDGIDALFDTYLRAYRSSWRAFPGVVDLLRDLRARGVRLGLLTNGAEAQQRDKLAATGLGGAFDVVCTSERIGSQKPDARAFATLVTELGVDAGACLFVGDDPERDIDGARRAGMRTVQVADGFGLRDAVLAAVAED